MARTAVTPTKLVPNGSVAQPAGTTIDATLVTNGVIISGVPLEELVLEVEITAVAGADVTIGAGDNPPAFGSDDLAVTFAQNDVKLLGPFTSSRFIQAGADAGSLFVDFEAGATGTLRAYHVPRTA